MQTSWAGTPDGENQSINSPISTNGVPIIGHVYKVPAREGRAVLLKASQLLTIINTHGSQVCDFWAFNAYDDDEYLSMPHVRSNLSHVTPSAGNSLVSCKRKSLLTFTTDTSPGVHDTLVAACDIHRYRQLGIMGYHDNCTDNLRMAMIAIGRSVRHIPSPLNIWMNTPVRSNGAIDWLSPVSHAGDEVAFRAEIDVVAVMSACPQDMVPVNGADKLPRELEFHVK